MVNRSAPVLFDHSSGTSGQVVIGENFVENMLLHGFNNNMTGRNLQCNHHNSRAENDAILICIIQKLLPSKTIHHSRHKSVSPDFCIEVNFV